MTALAQFGLPSVLCGVLLLRDWKRDERDAAMQKDRIEADKALTAALTLVAERVR